MSSVHDVERRVASEKEYDTKEWGLAWAALGLIYCFFGELQRAMDCYRSASVVFGEHPELAMEIGKLLVRSGLPGPAEVYLRVALKDDKTRTGAHFFLSQIQIGKGLLDEAQEHLMSASEAAPTWHELIDRLSQIHAQVGNHDEAQACRLRCDVQRMQAERLLRELNPCPATSNLTRGFR